jgi:hypothetical protein
MDIKKIEKVSTITGVVLLTFLAIFGTLGCIESVTDVEISRCSRRGDDIWTIIPLITCVLIFCCFLVSTMLNVSRIANSVEVISNKSKEEC